VREATGAMDVICGASAIRAPVLVAVTVFDIFYFIVQYSARARCSIQYY
jgi:hypothetical protein